MWLRGSKVRVAFHVAVWQVARHSVCPRQTRDMFHWGLGVNSQAGCLREGAWPSSPFICLYAHKHMHAHKECSAHPVHPPASGTPLAAGCWARQHRRRIYSRMKGAHDNARPWSCPWTFRPSCPINNRPTGVVPSAAVCSAV